MAPMYFHECLAKLLKYRPQRLAQMLLLLPEPQKVCRIIACLTMFKGLGYDFTYFGVSVEP